VQSGLVATMLGLTMTAAGEAATWGEFGGCLEARLTNRLALDLDFIGTTGGSAFGTVLHGGVGVVWQF
jgi:hypothetical protein